MTTRGSKIQPALDEQKIIRVECNMEEFPYFRLSKRDARTLREIYYSRETRNPEGEILLQEWIVRAAGTLGLPGPFDQDVYVALEEIIDERGIDDAGALPFTKYRIAEIMGKGHSGIIYQKITGAIERMIATSITSGKALYSKDERHHISGVFALYDEVSFYNRTVVSNAVPADQRRNIEYNILYPSRWYVDSRRANYTKPLNTTFYRSLALPTSKKLYRLLDKRSYPDRTRIEMSLDELARALPLTEEYPSFLKKVLDKAHAELTAGGFLAGTRYEPMRGRDWKVVYLFPRQRQEEPVSDQLARMLLHRGIARPVALELARRLPERVPAQVEIFDWLLSTSSPRVKTNPAGFLRKSIEDDYSPPPGFISESEKKSVRDESLRKIREKQAEMERQERERLVLLEKIREIRDSLPPDSLAAVEAEAEANLNAFMKRKLKDERREGHLKPTTKIALEEEMNRLIEMKYMNKQ
ncbi:MAG TPA: replication initiator protein A [Planctomycetota bacterium]|nr:replication initiator protein A [Planctomycetota bacterium]